MAILNNINSLTNKISPVDKNGKKLKNQEGKEIVVGQTLAIDPLSEHFFEFSDQVFENGTPTKREIFSIDKAKDDGYTLKFSDLSLFKTADGKTLVDELGTATLDIKPGQGSITISKEHGATCFQITASSGKVYTITSDATSIKIADNEGNVFSHTSDFQAGIGVDVSLNASAVEAFLDKDNEMFRTTNKASGKSYASPKDLNDFPIKNLALYAGIYRGNESAKFGDYSITTIDPSSEKDNTDNIPYFFISKQNEKDNTKDNFLFINGKFERLEKMNLLYEVVNGVEVPRLVIQIAPKSAKNKNSVNRRSIALDLKQDKDGNFTSQSKQAIELLSQLSGYEAAKEPAETDKTIGGLVFSKKDERDYADYVYNLKPETYNMLFDDNDDDDDDGSDDKTPEEEDENHDFVEPIVDDKKPPEENNENDKDDKKPQQETEAKPEDKEDDKDKPLIKSTKEHDFKKFAENYGNAIAVLGFFIGIGALLTGGLVALAFIGMALVGVGSAMVAFKDKAVIKSFDIAYSRVAEIEEQEDEDNKFAEKFHENEKDLNKSVENMYKREQELYNFLYLSNENANSFYNIYENYGVGFSQDLEAEHSIPRFDRLMSSDGLKIKQNMLSSLKNIQNETTTEKRNVLINNFINSNFNNIPEDKKDKFINNMFSENKADYLNDFINHLDVVVRNEEKIQSMINNQEAMIEKSNDRQLSKIMNGKEVDQVTRKKILDRYAHAIIRRLSVDKNINETKLDMILKDVPNEEKVEIFDSLIAANDNINSSLDKIDVIAKENRDSIANLQQAANYAKVMNELESNQKEDKFHSYQEARNSVEQIILNKSIRSIITKDKEIASNINLDDFAYSFILEEFNNDAYTTDCQNLITQLFTDFNNLFDAPLEKGVPSGIILPDLKKPNLESNQGTFDEIIATISSQKDKQNNMSEKAIELSEAYNAIQTKIFNNISTKTSDLCKNILTDISTTFGKNINQLNVSEDEVLNKVTSLKNTFMLDMRYTEVDLTNIATTLSIIEKAIEIHPFENAIADDNMIKLSKEKIDNYKSTINVIENVLNGSYFELCFDRALVDAGCNYSKTKLNQTIDKFNITTEMLEQQLNDAKTNIQGYQNTNRLIDALNLSTEHEEGKLSERQNLINKLKEISSGKDISTAISDMLKNKKITTNIGSLKFDDIYKKGIILKDEKDASSKEFSIKKAEEFINNQINILNAHAKVESHCYDKTLGEKTVDNELNRQKAKHNKNKKKANGLEDINNVYDLILNLLKQENKLPTTENAQPLLGYANFKRNYKQELIDYIVENPEASPKNIAKHFGIYNSQFKKEYKEISKNGLSIDAQKELWIKENKFKEFSNIAEEFKYCWEESIKNNNYNFLNMFVDNAIIDKKMKKKISADVKRAADYSNELLSSIGLNAKDLQDILKDENKDNIKNKLNEIDNTGIEKQVNANLTDKQNEIETLKIKKDLLNEDDKNLLDELNQLDQLNQDIETFEKKVGFIESLAEKGVPEDIVDKAIEAFAKGDTKFFEKQAVEIKNDDKIDYTLLINLCKDANIDFEAIDPVLLRRLKIKPEELAKSDKKKKLLQKIRNDLKVLQQEKNEDFSASYKKALTTKMEKPFEKQERRERGNGLRNLFKLFSKAKEKAQAPEKDWLKSDSIKKQSESYTNISSEKENKNETVKDDNNKPKEQEPEQKEMGE